MDTHRYVYIRVWGTVQMYYEKCLELAFGFFVNSGVNEWHFSSLSVCLC